MPLNYQMAPTVENWDGWSEYKEATFTPCAALPVNTAYYDLFPQPYRFGIQPPDLRDGDVFQIYKDVMDFDWYYHWKSRGIRGLQVILIPYPGPTVGGWNTWCVYAEPKFVPCPPSPLSAPKYFDKDPKRYKRGPRPADLRGGDVFEKFTDDRDNQLYYHWKNRITRGFSVRQVPSTPSAKPSGSKSAPMRPAKQKSASNVKPHLAFTLVIDKQTQANLKLWVVGARDSIVAWKTRLSDAEVTWNPSNAGGVSCVSIRGIPPNGSVDFTRGDQRYTTEDDAGFAAALRLEKGYFQVIGDKNFSKDEQMDWLHRLLKDMRRTEAKPMRNSKNHVWIFRF